MQLHMPRGDTETRLIGIFRGWALESLGQARIGNRCVAEISCPLNFLGKISLCCFLNRLSPPPRLCEKSCGKCLVPRAFLDAGKFHGLRGRPLRGHGGPGGRTGAPRRAERGRWSPRDSTRYGDGSQGCGAHTRPAPPSSDDHTDNTERCEEEFFEPVFSPARARNRTGSRRRPYTDKPERSTPLARPPNDGNPMRNAHPSGAHRISARP